MLVLYRRHPGHVDRNRCPDEDEAHDDGGDDDRVPVRLIQTEPAYGNVEAGLAKKVMRGVSLMSKF